MENVTKFNEWMRKIKNVFYSDNERMCNTYWQIIEY